MVEIFTDGACSGNPGKGGFGVVMKYNQHRKELSQGYLMTTNNRMELMAAIAGLEALKSDNMLVTIWSDSKYVVDSVEKGWIWSWVKKNFKDKANPDLWQKYIALHKKHTVKFQWIKGHAGHPENECCDKLAVVASQKPDLLVDEGYKKSI